MTIPLLDHKCALPAVRELRWSYIRGAERQCVHLSLDAQACAYEFHVRHADRRSSMRIERYIYASDAIERHCEYEAELLAAGFSLDSFER